MLNTINASTLQPDKRIHALLIGPGGVGKTAAACSFPGKTVILDFDDRASGPLLGCSFLNEKVRSGQVECVRIVTKMDGKDVTYNDVIKYLEMLDQRVSKNEVQNVILDSTTSMKKFFVNDSLNNLKVVKHYGIGDVNIPQKQDYNYTAVVMSNIIYDNLKTFKCNLFVSTHLKDKLVASPTPEEPDRVIVVGQTITAPGQLAIEIPTWFNEVWEFQLEHAVKSQPPKRFVLFQSIFAHTSFQELGYLDVKQQWIKAHRLEITDKSLFEVLKPTFERMRTAQGAKA